MSEFTPLREALDSLAGRAPSPDFSELRRRATHRGRRRAVMLATATVAVIAGSVFATTALDGDPRTLPAEPDPAVTTSLVEDRPSPPVEQPKPVVDPQPVWYDAKGLHRGDVVESTPVALTEVMGEPVGALALVRSGAVYLDPAKNDVWFHPWGGKPLIVGHNSSWGPGGDPHGDTAAWFEGSSTKYGGPGELVVYNTAAGREISRTAQTNGVAAESGLHIPAGNGFKQVSADHIVWRSRDLTLSHDVRTEVSAVVEVPLEDRHDQLDVFFDSNSVATRGLVLRAPGRPDARLPNTGMDARLSPTGNHLLAISLDPTAQGAVIIDTRTGDRWRVPKDVDWSTVPFTPQLAWSYGDIAMLDYTDEVLACDAARRMCERVPVAPPNAPLLATS